MILAGETVAAAETAPAAPRAAGEPLPSQLYADVARAFRAGDLETAGDLLDDLAGDGRAAPADVELLLGLAAWSRGDGEEAADHLGRSASAGGVLGDWRLWVLADLAADGASALPRYEELIEAFPASPLRPAAMVTAARLHRDQGSPARALGIVERARRDGVEGSARVDLEELAWRLGGELGDESIRRPAARRLLAWSPWKASAMGIPAHFLGGDGRVDWAGVLSPSELRQRARSFLEGGQPQAALATLAEVPAAERDLDWHLLRADALVRTHDGRGALAALAAAPTRSNADEAAVEWHRALATADLATARGAGRGLPTSQRAALRDASLGHLRRVAALGGDPDLAVRALRRLYRELDGADFDRQTEVLRELRRFDPTDRTGAEPLWTRGWREYRDGNQTAAVAYWTELAELYPGDREAHRGLYWKARAFEDLGEGRRAHHIYEELVAASDTNDFYRTQAMTRLGSAPRLGDLSAAMMADPRSWEIDPLLRRAKVLTDLGLDDLARMEIERVEAVHPEASHREAMALRALMQIRSGERRAGIVKLRQAFPELGGPAQGSIPTEILRAYYPLEYEQVIREEARNAGVPAHLVAGIIRQESAFDPRATSPVGARGLMQVMPATAREVAGKLDLPYAPTRLYDPQYSVRLGATYFAQVLEMFDGNVELSLAGYNGGPNRIRRLWKEQGSDVRLDDFFETLRIDESRNYVKRILVLADSYRQLYPEVTPLNG